MLLLWLAENVVKLQAQYLVRLQCVFCQAFVLQGLFCLKLQPPARPGTASKAIWDPGCRFHVGASSLEVHKEELNACFTCLGPGVVEYGGETLSRLARRPSPAKAWVPCFFFRWLRLSQQL